MRGYVVVAANPRGSSGRGEAYARAIYADWGNKDVEDVLAAVDYAVVQGSADPTRLGIGGWGYGVFPVTGGTSWSNMWRGARGS